MRLIYYVKNFNLNEIQAASLTLAALFTVVESYMNYFFWRNIAARGFFIIFIMIKFTAVYASINSHLYKQSLMFFVIDEERRENFLFSIKYCLRIAV